MVITTLWTGYIGEVMAETVVVIRTTCIEVGIFKAWSEVNTIRAEVQ